MSPLMAAGSNDLDLNDLSRVVLAVACLASAVAAGSLAWITHPKYTPHLVLIAFWSLWAGLAMTTLAFERFTLPFDDDLLTLNLNGAFVVVVGGWAFFAVRLWHEARLMRVARDVIVGTLQGSASASASPTASAASTYVEGDLADALHLSVESTSTATVESDTHDDLHLSADSSENLTVTMEDTDE